MSTRIVYVQVPGFYAEVERSLRPELRGRPLIVGGDPRKGGRVQAATADARRAGVVEKMPVLEALERCPGARALRTNMRRYRETDARLRTCLRQVLDRIEPAGLGAAFLDATGHPEDSEPLARRVHQAVQGELGLSPRVGVAPVKFVARLAAEEADPGGIRVVPRTDLSRFLDPLPVSRLPGVGPNTEERLRELGASSAADLRRLGDRVVEAALGRHGLGILAAARGQGDARIHALRHPQTLSQEVTLESPERDRRALAECLEELAGRLERALRLEDLAARRVTIKVRYAEHDTATRSITLERPVARAGDLHAVALELLGRTQAGVRAVRLIGLAAGRLLRARRDERQLDLFDTPPAD